MTTMLLPVGRTEPEPATCEVFAGSLVLPCLGHATDRAVVNGQERAVCAAHVVPLPRRGD